MIDRKFYLQGRDQFVRSLGRKAGKVVKYSILARFVLNLVQHKLNLRKVLKDSPVVLRIGLACGTFNVVYHLVRRYFAKRRQKSKRSIKDSYLLS